MTKEWNDIRAELGHDCLLVPNTRCVDTLFNNNFEFNVKEFINIIWKLYYNYHTDTVQKRDLDLANRARTKNPGVRDEVLQETALGLIQREKYKRLCPQSPA